MTRHFYTSHATMKSIKHAFSDLGTLLRALQRERYSSYETRTTVSELLISLVQTRGCVIQMKAMAVF